VVRRSPLMQELLLGGIERVVNFEAAVTTMPTPSKTAILTEECQHPGLAALGHVWPSSEGAPLPATLHLHLRATTPIASTFSLESRRLAERTRQSQPTGKIPLANSHL
jgi:hypothetical protein